MLSTLDVVPLFEDPRDEIMNPQENDATIVVLYFREVLPLIAPAKAAWCNGEVFVPERNVFHHDVSFMRCAPSRHQFCRSCFTHLPAVSLCNVRARLPAGSKDPR